LTEARIRSAAISWLRETAGQEMAKYRAKPAFAAANCCSARGVKPKWLFLSSKELTPDPICAADESKRGQTNPGNRTRRRGGKCGFHHNNESDCGKAQDAIHVSHVSSSLLRDDNHGRHLHPRTDARNLAWSQSGYFFRAKSLRATQYAPPIRASAGKPIPATGPGAERAANAGFNVTVRATAAKPKMR